MLIVSCQNPLAHSLHGDDSLQVEVGSSQPGLRGGKHETREREFWRFQAQAVCKALLVLFRLPQPMQLWFGTMTVSVENNDGRDTGLCLLTR